jgi:hypothetical protein
MTWKAVPSSRTKVALTIILHSVCSIWSILQNKTALNSLNAPILLLVIQTFVQVVLLTAIGLPLGWIKLPALLSVNRQSQKYVSHHANNDFRSGQTFYPSFSLNSWPQFSKPTRLPLSMHPSTSSRVACSYPSLFFSRHSSCIHGPRYRL